MTEKLLQFIWQFQYFNNQFLTTTLGEPLQIIFAGRPNTNQGPDFSDARIIINNTTWAGSIEIHTSSSKWLEHGHQSDARFNKIILHVVWIHNKEIKDDNNNHIPTLELQPRVSKILLEKYNEWMTTASQIPCEKNILQVQPLTMQAWKERLAIERLMAKYNAICLQLTETENHWEEVFWRTLCRYFGGNVNSESFEQIAASLPLQILVKHKSQIHQLEALLLGQAGLLHKNFGEDYPKMLYREYAFLQHKYKLRVVNLPPSFLRMRPQNFPTIRLAQLAMLVHTGSHLFSKIIEANSPESAERLFTITANDYWHYHFKFDEISEYKPKKTGKQLTTNLLINCFVPITFAYGQHTGNTALKEKALHWLRLTHPEKNSLIAPFTSLGIISETAFDTQALLQLKKNYCDAKHCLNCAVGNSILRRN